MYVCVYMVGIQVCISSECVYGTTIERKREREWKECLSVCRRMHYYGERHH